MLDKYEVEKFHKQGYIGPYSVFSSTDIEKILVQIETDTEEFKIPSVMARNSEQFSGSQKFNQGHNRHLDCPSILYLSTHPGIINRIKHLLGEDLLIWRSNFFIKKTGGVEIPWHQDSPYWPLVPNLVCTAWIAIDDSTKENGCVQVIPGSHLREIPHISAPPGMNLATMADPDYFNTNDATDLEMQQGEVIFFNNYILHHSFANNSNKRRMGLAIRIIPPLVRVMEYDDEDHQLLQVSGKDTLQFNKVAPEEFAASIK
tara:strand:+ start:52 stop:828 length:777 start_codon:yes stop_codon:yes gene_type:complete